MKKVCLINPILFSSQVLKTRSFKANLSMSYFPPLALAYIAGVLEKNGIEVMVIDRALLMRKFDSDLDSVNEECVNKIKSFSPHYVGITTTTPTFLDVKKNITSMIKGIDKNIPVVLGGSHATALPGYILQNNSNIDIVCRGEGELTMLDIASGTPLPQIKGITYRDGERIVNNPARHYHPDIDDFYPPARHLLEMDSYCEANPHVMHGIYMSATTIFTSRGCPFNCTFCAGKVALGQKVRYQSNDLVMEEILHLYDNYGIEGLYFADDMFEAKKSRLKQICGMLIDSGIHKKIKWIAQVRVNTVDEEVLKLMKEAGCIRLEFGFETGSQKVLDILNKRTTVKQNYKAAKVAKKVGLSFQANIIVGMPGEDSEDFQQTIKFLKYIKPHWIGFGEFVPLPGSILYDDLLKKGKISVEAVEKLEGFNFTNLSNEEFEKYIKNINRTIVLPIRVKNFILDNMQTPQRCIFLIKFIIFTLRDLFVSAFYKPSKV